MAFLPYLHPDDVDDPLLKEQFQRAFERKGGQEPMSLRAHHPWFAHWWYQGWENFRTRGVIEPELLELMRVRCSTSWEKMMGLPDCHY